LLPLCIATCNPQVGRYIHAVKGFQLDAFLAPYDLASHNHWRQLAGHISAGVVDALQPVGGGNINVLAEADPALLRPATAAEEVLYAQLAKGRAEAAAAPASGAAGAEAGTAAGEEAAAAEGVEGVDEMQTEQQPTEGAAPAAAADQQQQQQEGGRWAAAPHAGRCFYTPLPRLVKRGGLTPQELTGGRLGERLGAVGLCGILPASHNCPVLPCLNSLLQPSTSTSPRHSPSFFP
jgi:A1 cistron-splicing factor AAR2